ncbi:unnamed protein product [Brassicogethes aeneus]|uniref:Uncharacterized protein n=1 Tax=Brassicogethes aeneus TaxID=1431903 RepID=A0A9P0AMS4_BRAAE|nr:unnamed protein product [Brassicogethes aeneus]
MNGICRVCLKTIHEKDSISILTKIYDKTVIQVIVTLSSIEVEPDAAFPKYICLSCNKQLIQAIELRGTIQTSDKYLKESLFENMHNRKEINNSDNDSAGDIEWGNLVEVKYENSEGENDVASNTSSTEYEKIFKTEVKHTPKNKKEQSSLNEKSFKCKECNRKFKQKRQYLTHMSSHTGIKPHNCTICSKGFSYKWALNLHFRTHTGEKPYQCNICKKFYRSPGALNIHKRIHNNDKRFPCKFCDRKFLQSCQLDSHIRTHTKEKPFLCDICCKTFADASSLRRHNFKHNPKPPEPCPICGKLCSIINLQNHIKRHSDEPKFECDKCDKKFKCKNVLKRHKWVHDGIKPYKCAVCEKAFSQNGILVRHLRVHSGETPFPCDLCEKRFTLKHHLQAHVKRYHPDFNDPEKNEALL